MFCIAMQLNEAVLCLGVPRRFVVISDTVSAGCSTVFDFNK